MNYRVVAVDSWSLTGGLTFFLNYLILKGIFQVSGAHKVFKTKSEDTSSDISASCGK